GGDEPPDLGGRDAAYVGDDARVEAEPCEEREVAAPAAPEAERLACGDDLGADRVEVGRRELLRCERRHLGGELDHEHLLDAEPGEELQPPLERREERDPVPEHLARVRVERDNRRPRPRVHRRADDRPVADVEAVERADRDRARVAAEVGGVAPDLQGAPSVSSSTTRPRTPAGTFATASAGRRASASSTPSQRSGEASSTVNGPTADRRSETQWPPIASAIERTYVPEPTWRPRQTVSPVYSSTSIPKTIERRSGISTATPRRARR